MKVDHIQRAISRAENDIRDNTDKLGLRVANAILNYAQAKRLTIPQAMNQLLYNGELR